MRLRSRLSVRPSGRPLETRLLLVVAAALVVGWFGMASTLAGRFTMGEALPILSWLLALGGTHVAFVVSGRHLDQVLLPCVGLLGGLSLLMMERMPQGLVQQRIGDRTLGLAESQLLWLLLGLGVLAVAAISVRSVRWLRDYRYTWALVGIVLLVAVFVLGDEVNGARLSIRLGPVSGQPSELLKVILVVFLAAYLADNRLLLARASLRIGPVALPPLPYLLPMLAMWGIAVSWSSSSATWGRRSCCSGCSWRSCTSPPVAGRTWSSADARAARGGGAVPDGGPCPRAQSTCGSTLGRCLGGGLPGGASALRVRPRRRGGHRPRRGAAAGGLRPGDPADAQ